MSRQDIGVWLRGGASVVALATSLSSYAQAGALPGRGHFEQGSGAITKANGRLVVSQDSRTGIIDWKNFAIGGRNTVQFDNRHGATLNIVNGGNISRIAGDLHVTGSVYLINRSGIVVTGNGRIDAGGSVALSGGNANDPFSGNAQRERIARHAKGDIRMEGAITAGQRLSVIGQNVRDGGQISATKAWLMAGERAQIGGIITAKRHVETSGARLHVDGANVRARSWLLDPKNLKITKSVAASIANSLDHGTDVSLRTTASAAHGPGVVSNGPGDITIAAPLTWSTSAKLTLDAHHSVIIDALVHVKKKGALELDTNDAGGSGGDLSFAPNASITFDMTTASLKINGHAYALEADIGSLASAIGSNPTGRFALANNVNAGGQVYATAPIGTAFSGTFDGLGHTLSKLRIDDVTDTRAGLFANVEVGAALRNVTLSNVDIHDMTDSGEAGALAAYADGTITNVRTSGSVVGGDNATGAYFGGLVGYLDTDSAVENAIAAVTVSGGHGAIVGGLAGQELGTIAQSKASGTVSASDNGFVGGLVGAAAGGSITKSSASGNVYAGVESLGGGLAGEGFATITLSHASGDVSVVVGLAGGFVGQNFRPISRSYATGNVQLVGDGDVGGFAGISNSSGTIDRSFATGNVFGATSNGGVGGFIGENNAALRDSYSTGSASGTNGAMVGGFVGINSSIATLATSYSTGAVSGDDNMVGGFAGDNDNASGFTNDYYDKTTTHTTFPVANGDAGGVNILTTKQLKSALPGGFSASIWALDAAINGGLPYLKANPPQ